MHRRPLLRLLDRYRSLHPPGETAALDRICALVSQRPDCFERSCLPAHVTASAWIASHDRKRFLLTHHRKLDRWLQLGGHADGDPDVMGVALREAQEESGMRDFSWLSHNGAEGPVPLDIDVHAIPACRDEPAHEHHDVRFLLVAAAGQALQISAESSDLVWFELAQLEQVASDESLLRLGRKARSLLLDVGS